MLRRQPLLIWLFLNTLALPFAVAAAQTAVTSPAQPAAQRRTDFKVVFWFRRDDRLGTFQYQIYDVRKQQYTPAVDVWIEMVRKNYPAYEVIVREVDLSRERGATELLKVGAVIHRELIVAAGLQGVFLGGGLQSGGVGGYPSFLGPRRGPSFSRGPTPPSRGIGSIPRGPREPAPVESRPPFPIPYPRPHP